MEAKDGGKLLMKNNGISHDGIRCCRTFIT